MSLNSSPVNLLNPIKDVVKCKSTFYVKIKKLHRRWKTEWEIFSNKEIIWIGKWWFFINILILLGKKVL